MTPNLANPIRPTPALLRRAATLTLAAVLCLSSRSELLSRTLAAAPEPKPAEPKPAETKPAETKPAETKPAETKPAEPAPEPKAEPKPSPESPEAQQKARQLFDELFGADFTKASASRDNALRQATARKLAESVPLTREDPALWALLTQRAAELASGGTPDKAGLELAGDLLTRPPPEGIDLQPRLTRAADVLDRLMRLERGPERANAARKLIDTLVSLSDIHAAASHFDDAAECLTKATAAARLAQLTDESLPRIKELEAALATQRKDAAVLDEARKILTTNPNDPTANVVMGLHEYFTKQNALAAAGFLAKGEAGFKSLAEALLTEPADEVKLGDGFRTAAELDAAKKHKMPMLVEARKHYQTALDADPMRPDALKLKLFLTQLAEKTKGYTPTIGRPTGPLSGAWLGGGKSPWAAGADLAVNNGGRWAPLPKGSLLLGVRPDGKLWLIVQAGKRTLFDPSNGRSTPLTGGPDTAPRGYEFTFDGRKVLQGHRDQLNVWDATTAKHLYTRPLHLGVYAVSPDGKTLAQLAADRSVKLLSMDGGTELRSIATEQGVTAVVFSPDSRAVVLGYVNGAFDCFEATSGKKLFSSTADPNVRRHQIGAMAFTPDAANLIVAHASGAIDIWDVATNKSKATINDPNRPTMLVVSPNGGLLAVSERDDRTVRVYDLAAAKLHTTLDIDRKEGSLLEIAFNSAGKRLVAWHSRGDTQFWSTEASTATKTSGPPSKKRPG